MFESPLTSTEEIIRRRDTFKYFHYSNIGFPYDSEQILVVENYIESLMDSNYIGTFALIAKAKIQEQFIHGDTYAAAQNGIRNILAFLTQFQIFSKSISNENPFGAKIEEVATLIQRYDFPSNPKREKLSFIETVKLTYLLNRKLGKLLKKHAQFGI